MAFPFITERPIIGRPTATGTSFGMVTDPAHATAVGFRIHTTQDGGGAEDISDAVVSSGGTVQERLVAVTTGLAPDTLYSAQVEYEEVAGSGTWVESTFDPVTFWVFPESSGTAEIVITSDPHVNWPSYEGFDTDRELRYLNTLRLLRESGKAHLWVRGGDEHVAAFESTANATEWGIDWRNTYHETIGSLISLDVLGNHENRDGSGDANDLLHNVEMLTFRLNQNTDVTEKTGTVVVGPVTYYYTEPYTGSGLPIFTPTSSTAGGSLGATRLGQLTDVINAWSTPWLVVDIHNWPVLTPYQRVGGQKITNTGSDGETIHAALVASLTDNVNAVGIVCRRGHDHVFEHSVIDRINYIAVGTAAQPLGFGVNGSSLFNAGYWADTVGTWATGVKSFSHDLGYARLSLSPTQGWLRLIQTGTDGVSITNSIALHSWFVREPYVAGNSPPPVLSQGSGFAGRTT